MQCANCSTRHTENFSGYSKNPKNSKVNRSIINCNKIYAEKTFVEIANGSGGKSNVLTNYDFPELPSKINSK